MQVKIIDDLYYTALRVFDCNAAYSIPRVGENVSIDSRRYTVERITHDIDDCSVTITVSQDY